MKVGQHIFRTLLKTGFPRPPPPEPGVRGDGFDGLDPLPAEPALSPRNLELARKMVKAGGSGDASDVEVVVRELAALPTWILEKAKREKVEIVACRGSVTDYLIELRGQQPRGWPPGVTWDSVPGSGGDPIVIATIAGPLGQRVLPPKGAGHGADSLLRHELGHALDHEGVLGLESTSREFMAAYDLDRDHLLRAGKAYLLQPAPAGPEETFAEMFDWYTGGNAGAPPWGPNLHALFSRLDERSR